MFNLFKKVKPQEGGKSNDEVLKARHEAREIVLKANEDIARLKQEAKQASIRAAEEALRIKQEAERDARRITEEVVETEKKLVARERQIDERDRHLSAEKENTERLKKEVESTRDAMLVKLEKIASMTKEQAKEFLLNAWEDKLKADVAKRIKQAEEEVKQNVEEKAKEILVDSMKHGATDYVAEFTLSTFALPNEEFKGRIIGKDGRNIRAFELATGVDVDLEEEGVIKLSSFDAVKREVARISLERLIRDGRIQPQRIEEIVQTVRRELDRIMFKAGEELSHKVGVYNLPAEATQALGKFKYRYSYGQNMILHTLEETKIGIALAHELHADVNVVKLGCLMHDIGKVIDSKDEGGSHVTLGVEFLKKHRFNQKVIDTVASHHEDVPFPSVEAVIVYIADAISGGRPGARHEDFEEYLKRIKTIEDAAKTKKGVRDAYALQAGRELRVIVRPDEISDDDMTILAQTIREELEQKFEVFPGQIKVTIIRESRTEATTKI
ncbi:ribonuclease Y [Candidatus Microgenomates bacterium]|nr:ribonuclease Y [Candidatus Microgenomates bacterium]